MRIRALSAVAAIFVVAACQPTQELTDAQRTSITAEVIATVDSLYAAMNEHDADRVLGHYLQSDQFLYVGVSESVQGLQTFTTLVRPWYASHPDVTFEHQILHVQALAPDVATVTVRGGSTEVPYLMWTRTLVRQDGRWLIALEHESWPGAEEPTGGHPSM